MPQSREYQGQSALEWYGKLGPDDPPKPERNEDDEYERWKDEQEEGDNE